jgi:actin-related protein
MIENSRREDIIIELGQEYIRVGLVGDKVPRKTIKASQYFSNPKDYGSQTFEMLLEELLYNIFFSFINCTSQGKTVILLEKVFTDRRIIELMASIMFRKLKIEKLELALSCVTPLYLTGKYSGLVVSAGASCVELMPIYEGYPLFQSYQCLKLGTQQLNSLIRD